MVDTVERTAIAAFYLRGEKIQPGRVVELTPAELTRYSDKQCVFPDDARNAEVPKADILTFDLATSGGALLQQQISAASADIAYQSAALDKRDAGLTDREKALEGAATGLGKRAAALDDREKALTARESELNARETKLSSAEAQIADREKKATEAEAALADRESAVAARESATDDAAKKSAKS